MTTADRQTPETDLFPFDDEQLFVPPEAFTRPVLVAVPDHPDPEEPAPPGSDDRNPAGREPGPRDVRQEREPEPEPAAPNDPGPTDPPGTSPSAPGSRRGGPRFDGTAVLAPSVPTGRHRLREVDLPAPPECPVPAAPPDGAGSSGLLTPDTIVRMRNGRPGGGWRRAVWDLSGGRLHPGLGSAERDRSRLLARIGKPLRGAHRIAVVSVKGGVGKTTVSACLGLTFAELRDDRIVVMDANPDMGTLADRLTGDTSVTVQHLLDHLGAAPAGTVHDLDAFVSRAGRLHVLAGGQDADDGLAFTREEYEEAVAALSRCYNLVLTDSGTGVNHSAMRGTIAAADAVVIIGAPTVDAASRASMTLEWLRAVGRPELARGAIVVLSQDRRSKQVDQRVIREHFAPRCRAVVEVPADPHLATGGRIDLDRCRAATRYAFVEMAAELADGFPARRRRRPDAGRRS